MKTRRPALALIVTVLAGSAAMPAAAAQNDSKAAGLCIAKAAQLQLLDESFNPASITVVSEGTDVAAGELRCLSQGGAIATNEGLVIGGSGGLYVGTNSGAVYSGSGTVFVQGNTGAVHGGPGEDTVRDNQGTFSGGAGDDSVLYNSGTFDGGAGDDVAVINFGAFNGGPGEDTVNNNFSSGHFDGGPDEDTIIGVNLGSCTSVESGC